MEEKIIITPKTKPLTASELISLRNIEISSIKSGLKKTKPDGSPTEAEELTRLYADLRKILSVHRIERLGGRSEAIWDSDRNAVKVLRKEGKFEVFGYFFNGDLYLEYYEALFLLELNRLEILYHSMRMSIEQAYTLLLGEEESIKYNIYLVYSMFSRGGYIVQKYQNLPFSAKKPTFEDCIWSILLNSVQNKPIPENIRNSEYFSEVERSANSIRMEIMNPEVEKRKKSHQETDEQNPLHFARKVQGTSKRKAAVEAGLSSFKRVRCDDNIPPTHKSFVDFLTKEEEYKRFESIFQSFDIIKLKPQFEYDETEPRQLEIQFDVYQHNDQFRKSEPKPPAFRLAILRKNQEFPNRTEISRCTHSQEYPVPVLVVSVSESKQIQAFLYYFT